MPPAKTNRRTKTTPRRKTEPDKVLVQRLSQAVPRLALSPEEAAIALGLTLDEFEKHILNALPTITIGDRKIVPVACLEATLKKKARSP